MGWTKRELVRDAYSAVGIASSDFDLTAEEWQEGLRKLDTMMASWNGKGIRLGYPLPSSPSLSLLDDDSDVPDRANEAIVLNLALRLAAKVGKPISIDTRVAAKEAYNVLLLPRDNLPEMQLDRTVPAGAGHKDNENLSLDEPTDALIAGLDSELEFE